jgi:hypothetical protein
MTDPIEAVRAKPGEYFLATETVKIGLKFKAGGAVYEVVSEPKRWGIGVARIGEGDRRATAGRRVPGVAVHGTEGERLTGFSMGGRHAGVDDFRSKQEPRVEPGDDPLARFVVERIRDAETEPALEVMAVYDKQAGPMAHRYAGHVRRDCVAFRRIVSLYLEPSASPSAKRALRSAMLAVANRWSDHHDFRDEWRLA